MFECAMMMTMNGKQKEYGEQQLLCDNIILFIPPLLQQKEEQ